MHTQGGFEVFLQNVKTWSSYAVHCTLPFSDLLGRNILNTLSVFVLSLKLMSKSKIFIGHAQCF